MKVMLASLVCCMLLVSTDAPAVPRRHVEARNVLSGQVNSVYKKCRESFQRATQIVEETWQEMSIEDLYGILANVDPGISLPSKDETHLQNTKVEQAHSTGVIEEHLRGVLLYQHAFEDMEKYFPVKHDVLTPPEGEKQMIHDMKTLVNLLQGLMSALTPENTHIMTPDVDHMDPNRLESMVGVSAQTFLVLYFTREYRDYMQYLTQLYFTFYREL